MQSQIKKSNKLTVIPNNHLFWFLKDGVRFDLSDPSTLDMYVQQVITRGGRGMLKNF